MIQPWFRVRTLTALGEALAGARQSAGLNQTKAAELTNTSRPTISRAERGHPVSTDTVISLLAGTGYEVLVVPRGSQVTVTTPDSGP